MKKIVKIHINAHMHQFQYPNNSINIDVAYISHRLQLKSDQFFEVALDLIDTDSLHELGLCGNDHHLDIALADLLLHGLFKGRKGQFLGVF